MPEVDLIAVTPYGRAAGSSRVRVYEWLDHLHNEINPSILNYVGARNASTSALASQPGAVLKAEGALRGLLRNPVNRLLIHREASPFSRGGLESRLLRAADLSVYDFDDALQWDLPRSLPTHLFPKPTKCDSAIRSADRVVAGNDVLAEWASNGARDVRVIPSCVEPTDYVLKTDYELHDPPRLIWIGSPSTEKYLAGISSALRTINAMTGARLVVISSGQRPIPALEHMMDRVDWNSRTFSAQLCRGDIGIAPLADTKYALGKCAYKVLQYGATGLSSIVSPVGANINAADRLGFQTVSAGSDWVDAVCVLLDMNSTERMRRGLNARRAVEQYYSFAAWKPAWASVFEVPMSTSSH